MKITIIYDNDVYVEGLKADWGFSCLVEKEGGPKILFDTGADGSILLFNMKKIGIDPLSIDLVVISHGHWDHTGGLSRFLSENGEVTVFVPLSCARPGSDGRIIAVDRPLEIDNGIYSTGELKGIEQSLAVRTEKGIVVVTGCSHPGVEEILRSASSFGKVYALIGGLHGFRNFDAVKDLEMICPCHCTRYKSEIKTLYPEKYVAGGCGKVIVV
jgi:7,8-dihydropterin-6-yl-methyl-4-(beta-D-ribofuranosyl)aminobenzene 5'-phosphate synthase